ncbi:MAG: hypothetical protein Q9163_004271 [Psora crenata]
MGYICFLFSTAAELVTMAANVGAHFIVNNLFGLILHSPLANPRETVALAVQQFYIEVSSVQPLSALVAFGMLVLRTVLLITPTFIGKELRIPRYEDEEDDAAETESTPLLGNA